MILNRTFQFAFIVSVAAHLVVISQGFNPVSRTTKPKPQKLEIRYIKTTKQEKDKIEVKGLTRQPLLNLPLEISSGKKFPPPFVNRDEFARPNKQAAYKEPVFSKPALIRPEAISIKKKVTLPPVDLAKIDNPLYLNYYQIVREKIRRAAYQSYSSNETGEAYVTFIISNDGYLKDLRLVEEKSTASIFLKEIALASVKNASPFPRFPKDLDYPRLSFNVVISFEVE